jgi:hypothetical protein
MAYCTECGAVFDPNDIDSIDGCQSNGDIGYHISTDARVTVHFPDRAVVKAPYVHLDCLCGSGENCLQCMPSLKPHSHEGL